MQIALFIGNIILFICGIIIFFTIHLTLDKKNELQDELLSEINSLKQEKEDIIKNNKILKENLQNQFQSLQRQEEKIFQQKKEQNYKELEQQRQKQYKKIQEWYQIESDNIKKRLENEKQLANQNFQKNTQLQQKAIAQMNQQFETHKAIIEKEKKDLNNEIEKLKSSLSAGVQARLRQQEKKDKINFYKITISKADLEDVQKLQNLKISFHKPVVLSKLIWTQYFQKKMTELCDRVLGKKTVCGIYKITNLNTEQCYIGQSVDISKRWKDHCKCGLGIDASATNALYNSMQKEGVWNFSFELLEECSRDLLNEKERFWIETYSSNIYGLNTLKGINK